MSAYGIMAFIMVNKNIDRNNPCFVLSVWFVLEIAPYVKKYNVNVIDNAIVLYIKWYVFYSTASAWILNHLLNRTLHSCPSTFICIEFNFIVITAIKLELWVFCQHNNYLMIVNKNKWTTFCIESMSFPFCVQNSY